MAFFINVLSPSIQTFASHYRENQPHRTLTYNSLVQFARDEVEAFRAQAQTTLDNHTQQTRNQNFNTSPINLIDESVGYNDERTEGMHSLQEDKSDLESTPINYLPSTEDVQGSVMLVPNVRNHRDGRTKRREP